jgi:hypothetical protein
MAVSSLLRYSPVNWLIVDWGFNGAAFSECGLPEALPCSEESESTTPCVALPIQEAIDTYDWARWLPEVIVGIEDPDENIAADYVRRAAIEFARGSRVLQREVVVPLQIGILRYPLFPYDGERIDGVIGIKFDGGCGCACSGARGNYEGVEWMLDVARNELLISRVPRASLLKLLVFSAPTEDACAHDVFLYDRFHMEITIGARMLYANAVHFRDRALMASLPSSDAFVKAILSAKTKAMRHASSSQQQFGSGIWGSGRPATHYRGRSW